MKKVMRLSLESEIKTIRYRIELLNAQKKNEDNKKINPLNIIGIVFKFFKKRYINSQIKKYNFEKIKLEKKMDDADFQQNMNCDELPTPTAPTYESSFKPDLVNSKYDNVVTPSAPPYQNSLYPALR